MHSRAIRLPDGEQFNVGIGIHMGHATAGTIGSQERFEYTFIGDTVNIASRLDGLSKRLGYSIIISEESHKHLNKITQEKFIDLGEQKIRGKETPLHVYGTSTIKYIEQ
jgi:adenylate cyclase